MNYNNVIILENYQLLLEKALFTEYVNAANKSQKLKEKFKSLDSSVKPGYKYLNNPSKEQEVLILKKISQSNTFKAAAAGLITGAAGSGLAYGLSKLKKGSLKLPKFNFGKKKATEETASKEVKEADPKNESFFALVEEAILLSERGSSRWSRGSSRHLRRNRPTLAQRNSKSHTNSTTSTTEPMLPSVVQPTEVATTDSDRKPSFLSKHGKSLGIGAVGMGAGALAFAKVIAKNTKHVTIAGRKVYAILSKDQKTIFSMALPYTDGNKIEVKYIKASNGSL